MSTTLFLNKNKELGHGDGLIVDLKEERKFFIKNRNITEKRSDLAIRSCDLILRSAILPDRPTSHKAIKPHKPHKPHKPQKHALEAFKTPRPYLDLGQQPSNPWKPLKSLLGDVAAKCCFINIFFIVPETKEKTLMKI